MQVTFDSEEPLEKVLAVVSSLYNVTLAIAEPGGSEGAQQGGGAAGSEGDRTVKTRHLL